MKRFVTHIFALLLICAPVFALAQEGAGFVTRTLESALSGTGRDVRIYGFQGALSSNATLDGLTIADGRGVWLTLEGAELIWNRGALLRGRLEVEKLRAAHIHMLRRPEPVTGVSIPDAKAGGFELPQLPLSIDVQAVEVDNVSLDQSVLGEAADFTISASGVLGDKGLLLRLSARTKGGNGDGLGLAADFARADQTLTFDAEISENGGGIFARLLNMRGLPAFDLIAKGRGPLAAFSADLSLAVQGAEQITGRFDTRTIAGDRTLSGVLSGDLSNLVNPEYAPFFGAQTVLDFDARQQANGRIDVDRIAFQSDHARLNGRLMLNQDYWPDFIDITGEVGEQDGAAIALPGTDAGTTIEHSTLRVRYDAAKGEAFNAVAEITGLERAEGRAETLQLEMDGTLQGNLGSVGQFLAQTRFAAEGIAPVDAGLAEALNGPVGGVFLLNFIEGQPLRFEDINLRGPDFTAKGKVILGALGDGFPARFDTTLTAAKLSRFAGLARRPLRGSAALDITGSAAILGGSFDVSISGTALNLAVGDPNIDPLVAGRAEVAVQARRSGDGFELRMFELTSPAGEIMAHGVLKDQGSMVDLRVVLNDAGDVIPELAGPLRVIATAEQRAKTWDIRADLTGPSGAGANISGQLDDLRITGALPLALANPFVRPRQLQGVADFDLALKGTPRLENLSGRITTNAARFSAPNLRVALEDINTNLTIRDAGVDVDLAAKVASGGTLDVSGRAGLTDRMMADLRATLKVAVFADPRLYQTQVSGALRLFGPLTGGGTISGRLDVGETLLRVPASGGSSFGDLSAISHVDAPAAVRLTQERAGITKDVAPTGGTSNADWALDIEVNAPQRIFVRGRGIDAEMGGALRLAGTASNMISSGQLDLVRGRIDILGKRFDLVEGAVLFEGGLIPQIRFLTRTQTETGTAEVALDGAADAPEVTFSAVPDAPQDEVLAQLLFGRDLTRISAFQALQLASAVAELSGRGGAGIVGELRQRFGLDDLDVSTAADGATSLRAGKYISENVYSDVTATSDGTADVSLNLDLSPQVTVKGKLGSDGTTGVGIFFERDY